ncbi:MAG TPA: transposase [Chthonomonadaceae bacterium]|nr:transposase [Chthonomonadaceae bacterium]
MRQILEDYTAVQQRLSPVCYNNGKPLPAIRLQEAIYHNVKGIVSAQMTCSAIRSVAGAYRSAVRNGKPAQKPFQFLNKTALFLIGCRGRDAEIFPSNQLRIWTKQGKKSFCFTVPAYFQERFEKAVEFDSLLVIERRGRLIGRLVLTLEVPDPQGDQPCGIDRGELNALSAVDAEGKAFFRSGKNYRQKNKTCYKQRKRLQKRLALRKAERQDTKSVRRLLKRLGSKSSNRTKDFVRTTAKRLIMSLPEGSVLVLEDLNSLPQPLRTKKDKDGVVIQKGNRSSKSLRRRLSRWQYGQLQKALMALAELLGIPVVFVNAAYTSKTCHRCHKRGVRKRHRFCCPSCGLCCHADVNAAINIRSRYDTFCRVYARWAASQSAPKPWSGDLFPLTRASCLL